jgi:hypothetical protein
MYSNIIKVILEWVTGSNILVFKKTSIANMALGITFRKSEVIRYLAPFLAICIHSVDEIQRMLFCASA